MLFPNEKSLTFEDGVELGQSDTFGEFEQALQDSPTGAHHSATWQDFDWTRAQVGYVGGQPVAGTNGDTYLIARPKNPAKHQVWVYDEANSQLWTENGDWDPNTNQLDTSKQPIVSAANAPAPTPLQPGGPTPGAPLPGQAGNPYSGHSAVPMRMTGRPEEKVDPGNIGKMKESSFDDAMDALLGLP